ncbi:MAG: hypothetical protein CM15mP120_17060 [Pseudomonadota bacterium]|nr:MAG: hypothetical protein CM15mP120_17060 [Pseudomonadota bacterium]
MQRLLSSGFLVNNSARIIDWIGALLMLNNLGLFLTKRAHLSPDVEAYVESDGSYRLTYTELNDRCSQLANAFVAAGIEKVNGLACYL